MNNLEWGVAANINGDGTFRAGAKVIVQNANFGNGGDRVVVRGLSKGGRVAVKWVDAACLSKLRPVWLPGPARETGCACTTREEAAAVATMIAANSREKGSPT